MIARFRNGDRVCVTDDHHVVRDLTRRTIWEIVGEDTGHTPVHDPEPAYKLRAMAGGSKKGQEVVRYAYESCLALVADILGPGSEHGQEVQGQGQNGSYGPAGASHV